MTYLTTRLLCIATMTASCLFSDIVAQDEKPSPGRHWAFQKPQRPPLPALSRAFELYRSTWVQNEIDLFILKELERRGLTPNSEADRYTIARRIAFDITGIPPSMDIVEQFVKDSKSGAYDRLVERLLTSPHAGEHRARYWLDAARYGDTHGMHVDNYREMWPYRDWVVDAFNANMPFDQFVIEQVGGDLLTRPTMRQRIATGFNRCNITTSEGGAIPEEVNVRYMIDRVETTSTVFLGLTAGCAVCHDHKYDPISQREFYQLGAFFNNTTQHPMDGNQKDTPPVVTLPPDKFRTEWTSLHQNRTRLRAILGGFRTKLDDWWPTRSRESHDPIRDDSLILSLPLTQSDDPPTPLPKNAEWAKDHPGGKRGIRFTGSSELSAKLPLLRSDEPLTISFWFRTPDTLMSTTLFTQIAKSKDKKDVGWKITSSTQGALTFELYDETGKKIRGLLPGDAALTPRSWQHVCVRYSGGQSNSSITILVNGKVGRLRNSTEDLIGATQLNSAPLKIATRMPTASLSDVRIYRRFVSDREVKLLAQDHSLRQILTSDSKWSEVPQKHQALVRQFHDVVVDDDYAQALSELSQTQTRRDYIYSRSTTTLVMQERATKPRAWVLHRGEYDNRREEVRPAIPSVINFAGTSLTNVVAKRPPNRLDLAKWLVHPDHPLTARVMVNRLWQSIFGTGLVKTSEDFGTMGDRPTHPDLLDWLAVEFVESGWNVNHVIKLMVTSAAYRQSSVVTDVKQTLDPDNRYLARGPRMRLDAEMLRDQSLVVAGLLRRQMGGPSVKPYQPSGLWNIVAITGSNTRVFKRDSGDALYRRSLYTFWKRTSPPPAMAAFNAPTREQCTVRRERTNTPLQALILLNDPQYVEAARSLAERTIAHSSHDRSRAEWMLREALGRPASSVDIKSMTSTAGEFRGLFKADTKTATELIHTGESAPNPKLDVTELAAWTMIANIIMNRDDFLNK